MCPAVPILPQAPHEFSPHTRGILKKKPHTQKNLYLANSFHMLTSFFFFIFIYFFFSFFQHIQQIFGALEEVRLYSVGGAFEFFVFVVFFLVLRGCSGPPPATPLYLGKKKIRSCTKVGVRYGK